MDASAAGMREYSGRGLRERLENLAYVRAAVEALPPELGGSADQVSIVLPWGSLLAAVARPLVETLRGIRGLCRESATLDVVLALDPERDRAEILRLVLPSLEVQDLPSRLDPGYAEAGFSLTAVRPLDRGQLARWPSTWSRRLSHAEGRRVVQITARAVP